MIIKTKAMKNKKYSFDYDVENDMLYISIGEPVPGYESKITDSVFVRKNLDDDEVIGADIYDASKNNLKEALNKLPFFTPYGKIERLIKS